ncbi:MAG: DUF2000 domain-containing protein [Lapillicoccus sp.]
MTELSAPPQKIAVVLRHDLPVWQALNATAFLSAAVAGYRPDLLGESYADGDGTAYLSTFGIPIMVYAAPGPVLAAVRERAVGRGLGTAVFTDDMFATGNDVDNRAVVAAVAGRDLVLAGLSLVGPRNAVDKGFKGALLHP